MFKLVRFNSYILIFFYLITRKENLPFFVWKRLLLIRFLREWVTVQMVPLGSHLFEMLPRWSSTRSATDKPWNPSGTFFLQNHYEKYRYETVNLKHFIEFGIFLSFSERVLFKRNFLNLVGLRMRSYWSWWMSRII